MDRSYCRAPPALWARRCARACRTRRSGTWPRRCSRCSTPVGRAHARVHVRARVCTHARVRAYWALLLLLIGLPLLRRLPPKPNSLSTDRPSDSNMRAMISASRKFSPKFFEPIVIERSVAERPLKIKKVVKALKKASKAHAGQAKVLKGIIRIRIKNLLS